MSETKYTPEQLKKSYEDIVSLNFAYLDKAVKELNSMDMKNADNFSETEKQKFNMLHTAISIGLDLTHRTYPLCYEIFPENKKNLDNAYAMFKRFEAAKLLKECPCDYCKDHPVADHPVQDNPVEDGSVEGASMEEVVQDTSKNA